MGIKRNSDAAHDVRVQMEDELRAWRKKSREVQERYPDDEQVQANCMRLENAIDVLSSIVKSRRDKEILNPDFYTDLVKSILETQ